MTASPGAVGTQSVPPGGRPDGTPGREPGRGPEGRSGGRPGGRRLTGPLGAVVRAGVGRHRVRTVVMTLTVLVAVTASVLAAGLLVASDAPFDRAFAGQHGAHLAGQFDGTKVTGAQLAATARLTGVTAAAGPFPTVPARPRTTTDGGTDGGNLPPDIDLPPLTVVGRADPGGPVDHVTLLTGRWATGPGQIVLDAGADGVPSLPLGAGLRFPGLAGSPTLTVVGTARSVSHTADAWVVPAQIPALTATGTTAGYQMLYRFAAAATDGQITAGRAAIASAVPPGALTGAQSYLAVRQTANANSAAFVPFVAAFGVLGLAMSALIIGIVVSGAVGAATRRIGILKSLGFTPAQVVRAYLGQALIPASVGVVLGVLGGNLLAVPVLREQADAYGSTAPSIPVWVDIAVAAAALAVVAGAALAPALRAGRLSTVEAISAGRAPRAGHGRPVARLTGRMPVPRALGIGLAHPFARPARSAVLAAAVGFGAIGVTFAVGLGISLGDIQAAGNRDAVGPVTVFTMGPPDRENAGPPGPRAGGGPPAASAPALGAPDPTATAPDPTAVAAAITAQPGTRHFYGRTEAQVSVSGITGATTVAAYQGDSSWAAYQMISGTWFSGPGQAVVGTRFLHAAGIRVGDTVTATDQGHSVRLRIVGEALDLHNDGMTLLTDISTLTGLGLDARPDEFHVDLKPGTDLAGYIRTLDTAVAPIGASAQATTTGSSDVIATMEALIAMLTLGLSVVAALGVLNTVVLDTRERAHDLGVLKALGMTPRQTVGMVIASIAGLGAVAGLVGVPVGIALHHAVVPMMGHAVGTGIPHADIAVYHPGVVVPLALGGLVIAVAGALLPASWAARTRATVALRTE
ncbi:FtsX-like permease family protein [Pseudofrankia sp. BMG5.37]|uniref:ABC transporter permease n=1 Tax=Pseudofrankia sp. BMG5.37 TaxID=3050035 RepID=UPI002895C52C|nr:FtsX-like permease family protein [Pseudofrankia sp. BMG5.37]MDT3440951.1 FtsX-like permease family protein [Pseudofrankia sp. BMG5.37]